MRQFAYRTAAIGLALGALAGTMTAPAGAQESGDATGLTALEQNEVRNLIREHLIENPEIIAEAIEALRAKQEVAQAMQTKRAIAAHGDLLTGRTDTVMGNPEGDITIVEFSDYNCGYCKRLFPDLIEMVRADGNIRLVVQEFAILSESSRFAAKAAMAASRQGKYGPMHETMMNAKGRLTEESIRAIAADLKLDMARFEEDLADPALDKELAVKRELAGALGITGTPSVVIGDRLLRGARPVQEFVDAVAAERQRMKEEG